MKAALTSTDAAVACEQAVTAAYLQVAYGGEGGCTAAVRSGSQARSARLVSVDTAGDRATVKGGSLRRAERRRHPHRFARARERDLEGRRDPLERARGPMTYSIVARDPETGELGVAVQSHWFSVGSVVSWAEPAVGAVATQSIAEPAYGPRLLERLAAGAQPNAALEGLVAEDESARFRQVAVVDATGAVAAHTGDGCIPEAGHLEGDGWSVQANMMASAGVWPAMAEAFASADGPLARLLAPLTPARLQAATFVGGSRRRSWWCPRWASLGGGRGPPGGGRSGTAGRTAPLCSISRTPTCS